MAQMQFETGMELLHELFSKTGREAGIPRQIRFTFMGRMETA
jgi:hypothetical protein